MEEPPTKRVKPNEDDISLAFQEQILAEAARIEQESVQSINKQEIIDVDLDDEEFDEADFQRQVLAQQVKMKEMTKNHQIATKQQIIEKSKPKIETKPQEKIKEVLSPLESLVQAYTLSETLQKAKRLEQLCSQLVLDGQTLRATCETSKVVVQFKDEEMTRICAATCTVCAQPFLYCEHIAALLLRFAHSKTSLINLAEFQQSLVSMPKSVLALSIMALVRNDIRLLNTIQEDLEYFSKDLEKSDQLFYQGISGEVISSNSGPLPLLSYSGEENLLETSGLTRILQNNTMRTVTTAYQGCGGCDCPCHDYDEDYEDEEDRLCEDCRPRMRTVVTNGGNTTLENQFKALWKSCRKIYKFGDHSNALMLTMDILEKATMYTLSSEFLYKELTGIASLLSICPIDTDSIEEYKKTFQRIIQRATDSRLQILGISCQEILEIPFDSEIVQRIIRGEDVVNFVEPPVATTARIKYLKKQKKIVEAMHYAKTVKSWFNYITLMMDLKQYSQILPVLKEHVKIISSPQVVTCVQELIKVLDQFSNEECKTLLEIISHVKEMNTSLLLTLVPLFIKCAMIQQLQVDLLGKHPTSIPLFVDVFLEHKLDKEAVFLTFEHFKIFKGEVDAHQLNKCATLLSTKKQEWIDWISKNIEKTSILKNVSRVIPEIQLDLFCKHLKVSHLELIPNEVIPTNIESQQVCDLIVTNFVSEPFNAFVLTNIETLLQRLENRAEENLLLLVCNIFDKITLPQLNVFTEKVIHMLVKMDSCGYCTTLKQFLTDITTKEIKIPDEKYEMITHRQALGLIESSGNGIINITRTSTYGYTYTKKRKQSVVSYTTTMVKLYDDAATVERYLKIMRSTLTLLLSKCQNNISQLLLLSNMYQNNNILLLHLAFQMTSDPLESFLLSLQIHSTLNILNQMAKTTNPILWKYLEPFMKPIDINCQNSINSLLPSILTMISSQDEIKTRVWNKINSSTLHLSILTRFAPYIPEIADAIAQNYLLTLGNGDVDIHLLSSKVVDKITQFETINLFTIDSLWNWLKTKDFLTVDLVNHFVKLLSKETLATSYLTHLCGCSCENCTRVCLFGVGTLSDLISAKPNGNFASQTFTRMFTMTPMVNNVKLTKNTTWQFFGHHYKLISQILDFFASKGKDVMEFEGNKNSYIQFYLCQYLIRKKDKKSFSMIFANIDFLKRFGTDSTLTNEEIKFLLREFTVLCVDALVGNLFQDNSEITNASGLFSKEMIGKIIDKNPKWSVMLYNANLDHLGTSEFDKKLLNVPPELIPEYGQRVLQITLPESESPWAHSRVLHLMDMFSALFTHKNIVPDVLFHIFQLITKKILPPEVNSPWMTYPIKCTCTGCNKLLQFMRSGLQFFSFDDTLWSNAHIPVEWKDWLTHRQQAKTHTLTRKFPTQILEGITSFKANIRKFTQLVVVDPMFTDKIASIENPIVQFEHLRHLYNIKARDLDLRKEQLIASIQRLLGLKVFADPNYPSFKYLDDIYKLTFGLKY